jgi:LacI family transcriptional regulator
VVGLINLHILTSPNPLEMKPLIEGIHAYGRQHGGRWRYRVRPFETAGLMDMLRNEPCDAVIAYLWSHELAQQLTTLGKPLVAIHENVPHALMPAVESDDRQIGRLAAEHLVERGFDRFLFAGADIAFSHRRQAGFLDRLIELDAAAPPPQAVHRFDWPELRDGSSVVRWLRRFSPPLGVFGANDEIAGRILDAAVELGWHVPNDIGVIGVDNVTLEAEYGRTSLTSVDPDQGALGYGAAGLLDRIMTGEPAPPEAVIVPPRGVVARESTRRTVFEDPVITEAIRLIRELALEGLGVEEVLDRLPTSRSTLERRFRTLFGRSPASEVRRVRFDAARELLARSDMPLVEVAVRSGFNSTSYLCQAFRRELGMSPGQFRSENRRR